MRKVLPALGCSWQPHSSKYLSLPEEHQGPQGLHCMVVIYKQLYYHTGKIISVKLIEKLYNISCEDLIALLSEQCCALNLNGNEIKIQLT